MASESLTLVHPRFLPLSLARPAPPSSCRAARSLCALCLSRRATPRVLSRATPSSRPVGPFPALSRLLRTFFAFSAVLRPLRAPPRPLRAARRILIRAAPSARPTALSVRSVSLGAPHSAFSAVPRPPRPEAPFASHTALSSRLVGPSHAPPRHLPAPPRRLAHPAVSFTPLSRSTCRHAPPRRRNSPQRRHSTGRGPAPPSQPPSRILASHTTPCTPPPPLHRSAEGVSGFWRPNDASCALTTAPRAVCRPTSAAPPVSDNVSGFWRCTHAPRAPPMYPAPRRRHTRRRPASDDTPHRPHLAGTHPRRRLRAPPHCLVP
ncbi:hypothetical protein DENSPDRAFT_934578 [Dentipellis sp. KUC8613]|nr:hypothetical protein DENSPDRAFT_934578 [Dentipellis sp. KUC8613]